MKPSLVCNNFYPLLFLIIAIKKQGRSYQSRVVKDFCPKRSFSGYHSIRLTVYNSDTSRKGEYKLFLKRFDVNGVLYIEREEGGGEVSLDFDQIYREHFTDVYKYVLSLCRDEMTAEEVTQETFFKALRSIESFNGSCKLYVWLCQIAKNTYLSQLRKKKRFVDSDADIPSGVDLESDFLDKDKARRLHLLFHNLDEPYKEVFTLRVFGELPYSHIGELFGKTDSWARLVFYRAKKRLQEGLE